MQELDMRGALKAVNKEECQHKFPGKRKGPADPPVRAMCFEGRLRTHTWKP
jgi:hypothetical protein